MVKLVIATGVISIFYCFTNFHHLNEVHEITLITKMQSFKTLLDIESMVIETKVTGKIRFQVGDVQISNFLEHFILSSVFMDSSGELSAHLTNVPCITVAC